MVTYQPQPPKAIPASKCTQMSQLPLVTKQAVVPLSSRYDVRDAILDNHQVHAHVL